MELRLSDEQKMILESAQRFVAADYGFELRRARVRDGVTIDKATWRQIAELGWLGIGVAEERGGYGASIVESALIAEALAKGQVLEPYTMCGVLPSRILAGVADNALAQEALAGLIAGETLVAVAQSEPASRGDITEVAAVARRTASGWSLSGRKTLVVGGDAADLLLVTARDGDTGGRGLVLFLVDAKNPGLRREGDRLVDWTAGVDLVLEDCVVGADAALAAGAAATELLQAAVDEAIVALCAEAVGAMEGAIETTADYIKQRHQFGVPLSSFQALQHRMADMAIELTLARSAVICGLQALATAPGEERSAQVAGCKATVTRIGKWATSQGIQLHGGYGMTEEYKVGQYFKRLLAIDAFFGRQAFHLDRYARWMARHADAA